MSDAKSFGKSNVEQTVEERIASLEQRIPVYQERISAYDKLFDSLHEVILKLEMEKEKTDGHRNALDNLGKSIAELHNYQTDRINKLQSDLVNGFAEIPNQTNAFEALKAYVNGKSNSIMDELAEHKKDASATLATKANKDVLNDIALGHAKQIANMAKDIDALRTGSKQELDQLKEKLGILTTQSVTVASHVDDFSDLMKKFAGLKGDLLNLRDELPVRIAGVSNTIAQAIDELRKELASKPSEIVDLKNDVSKKLELMALDANSANLRSQNSDKKVFMLEKKIENLAVLVNKIELK